MKLYHFSPIKNEKELIKVIKYVAIQNSKLSKKIVGKSLPIKSLTVFSHYSSEFEKLVKILLKLGNPHNEHNGPRIILHIPVKVLGNSITHLRIRKPDPYRMQVGCSDFVVENYQNFKKVNLGKNKNLRLIKRQEYEYIEFFHPDFDVLGYVVSDSIHF